jgi:serine/threonine protein kinase
MELLDGETLAATLRLGPLPPALAARYGMEIADALASAHARGIIHRDLKPGNIMLTKTGVKVLDFGIAALTLISGDEKHAEHVTDEGRIPGTLAYMAPEQVAGEQCDARSDVYACGLLLYEMLRGDVHWLPPISPAPITLKSPVRPTWRVWFARAWPGIRKSAGSRHGI